jgi:hypothetical protein
VVACRRPRLCIACQPGIDDVASVTILGLPACVKDPLPDQRAPRVGGPFRRTSRVYRCFGALHAPVVPRAPLLTDAGRRAFSLLNGRLLDERLRLAVQVSRLGRSGGGHGPQQCRSTNKLLARSRGRVRVVDVEVDVDALTGRLA